MRDGVFAVDYREAPGFVVPGLGGAWVCVVHLFADFGDGGGTAIVVGNGTNSRQELECESRQNGGYFK